jgi:hypothetical protein
MCACVCFLQLIFTYLPKTFIKFWRKIIPLEGILMQNFEVHKFNNSNMMTLRTSNVTNASARRCNRLHIHKYDGRAYNMKEPSFENQKIVPQHTIYTSLDDDWEACATWYGINLKCVQLYVKLFRSLWKPVVWAKVLSYAKWVGGSSHRRKHNVYVTISK